MIDLNGIVDIEVIRELASYTESRFLNANKYQCAEALGLYEQKLLPNEQIKGICEKKMGEILIEPPTSYLPVEIINFFKGSDVVPVSFSPMRNVITCVALKEIGEYYPPSDKYIVDVVHTTIYNYFNQYTKLYGPHKDLMRVPAKRLFDQIVNEAITLGAMDITLSSYKQEVSVYYNVRKKKVHTQRILTANDMEDIIKTLCIESPFTEGDRRPKYVGVELSEEYRGRVVINHKYQGYEITIRVLSNAAFDKTLDDLGLSPNTVTNIRADVMNREKGLRITVGGTASGKNTTNLAMLREFTMREDNKVVSIEMPVEQILPGIEQINCDTEEEYRLNVESLLRQNPDMVYFTEMTDMTGDSIMKIANTGKIVMTTVHANSVSDTIGRLQDITGYSIDKIIQTLHSIIYQELVRDDEEDKIYPKNRYVYLSADRKAKLYGKDYGEVLLMIQKWEGGDVW